MADFGGVIVQPNSASSPEKIPPAPSADGNLSNPAGSEIPCRDLACSIRIVAQARADVLALQKWHERFFQISLANGDSFAAADDNRTALNQLYAAGFEVLDVAHHAGDAFDAICGISLDRLESVLEGIAWLLAPPELRRRIGPSTAWMITRKGLVSYA